MFQRFLTWIGQLLQGILGLILPLFSSERTAKLGRAAWIILHVLVIVGILAVLLYINSFERVKQAIRIRPPQLASFWLPILFLLLYAICWLSWWLWKLLISDELDSHFPDIDEAWDAAVVALRKARLDLKDLPLFLIIGQPQGDDE